MRKYNLPSNHDLFLDRTIEEHYEDYLLWLYEDQPLEKHRNEDGNIQLKDTGDPLIDKWEAEMAAGRKPNFREAFSEEQWAEIERNINKGASDPRLAARARDNMPTVPTGDIELDRIDF